MKLINSDHFLELQKDFCGMQRLGIELDHMYSSQFQDRNFSQCEEWKELISDFPFLQVLENV